MTGQVKINVNCLYSGKAKLSELELYIDQAVRLAGEGQIVVLTGEAPIWLYLSIAHACPGLLIHPVCG